MVISNEKRKVLTNELTYNSIYKDKGFIIEKPETEAPQEE